jgi:predicted O-methyltransferase YrrM
MIRRTARTAIRRALDATFPVWERLGLHVRPIHFYEPVPNVRKLGPETWTRMTEMVGVELRPERQLELLHDLARRYRSEYDAFPRGATGRQHDYHVDNNSFESVDGEMLHCMIRSLRPRRMIEIGSGFSTLLAAKALLKNEEEGAPTCDYVACDPYADERIRGGVPGLSRLIASPVQGVPTEAFERLEKNDILFIDSSHVLRIGSDVQYEFLEVLPRLRPGVYVHIHDIFLPAEYPEAWVRREHRFWTEQYLLQAFLTFNRAFEVIWAGSYMHLHHPDELRAAFASYGPGRHPGSFWIRRLDPDP